VKLCIDLDKTITQGKYDYPQYSKCLVNEEMVQWLRDRKVEGDTIIIHTARRLCDQVLTFEWLNKNNVPFDELIMAKPLADVYIDDKAIRFENIDQLSWDWEVFVESRCS